ncbi:glycosyltransferase family 4 protein [Pontibacter locisalis]|uniref:Glycosyltransferase family 4 protein n=1 Tax=Pontibacter locisalis TaxID=1719035 RepID=A0ABW5II13_9BACT
MRIAYFLPSLANSGPVLVVKDLVSLLKEQADITVYYFDTIVETTFDCPVVNINFLDKIDFSKYDILHSHMLRPDAYLFLNRKRAKGKLVSTIHNYVEQDLSNTHNKLISVVFTKVWNHLLSKHDKLVALSSHMQDYYKVLYSNRSIAYVYNGRDIDISKEENLPTEDLRAIKDFKGSSILLGVSAQLTRRKGVDQTVKLLQRMSNLKLLIIGDGPAKGDLMALAEKSGVSDRCLFLGYRKDGQRYNSLFDIYMMTSRSEGFPLAMIEAAAYGVPILASDLPVFKEAFCEDEVSFYQLENLDSMQHAMEELIVNRSTYSKNILAKYQSDYTAKEMASNYLQLYQNLISEA